MCIHKAQQVARRSGIGNDIVKTLEGMEDDVSRKTVVALLVNVPAPIQSNILAAFDEPHAAESADDEPNWE